MDKSENPTRTVVVGISGSESSTKALAWAMDLAAANGWSVEAVTAWPEFGAVLVHDVPGHYCQPRASAVAAQARAIAAASSAVPVVPPVQRILVNDSPVEALLKRSDRARLVVVGTRSGAGPHHVGHPTVGEAVSRRARCPVVFVDQHARVHDLLDPARMSQEVGR